VALALFACARIHAQTAPNFNGVFPNTNLVQSFFIGFAQGTCNDGTNNYWVGTSGMGELTSTYHGYNGGASVGQSQILAGLGNFGPLHLGDADYYQGYIYVPMEANIGAQKGAGNIDIGIFTATNLVRCAAVSISNCQNEASAVCIDPSLSNSVALFAANWASLSTNDGIYEYSVNNLTNLTFVKALPMSQYIVNMQGIICVGGMLYVIGDKGPSGEVYQVNPTNGVVTFLAELNIAGDAEWEGLDYFQGFLVANEGHTGTADWFDFFGASSTHRITGSVKDDRNNPIAGVGVIAAATINGTNQMIVTVDTDTNGNYSLNLTNGNWSVAVNCTSGNDSLGYLGNYSCPDIQNVNLLTNNAAVNFIVQNCNVIIGTTAPLSSGEIGLFYNQTLQASSCNPGYTWTLTDGAPPSGLSLSSDGTLSGTPSGPSGVFNFTVQVTDANNSTANQTFYLSIKKAVQIATTALPAGSFFNMSLSASNGLPPYTWSLSPGSAHLPSNFFLTTNGVLLGAATTYGTFNFSVRVKDNLAGIADQTLTVNILQPLAISTAGGQITVLWPPSATNFVLQCATNLLSPDWETVSDAVPGTAYTVTNTVPLEYFRLTLSATNRN